MKNSKRKSKHVSPGESDQEAPQEEPQVQEPERAKEEPKEDVPKGELLRRARLEQGLSLEAVHEATKVPMDALRAIEEGYSIRTLSPFYIKGFLKIYATYLGVDVTDVIDDYKKEELPKPIRKDVEDLDAQPLLTGLFNKERQRQFLMLGGIVVGLFLLFKAITFFTQKDSKGPSPANQTTAVSSQTRSASRQQPKKEPDRPQPSQPKPAAEAPKPAPAVSTSPSVQRNVTLTVRAKDRSWLRVKSDDQVVFQSALNEGEVETWTADKEVEITGRNIDQLEFELNGKLIGTLGRKDRRAKGVTATKDGLSVIK